MSSQLTGLRYLEANEIKNMKCDMDKPYVFFSYSHDKFDAQIVMNVFKALHNSGYNIWIDTANMPHDENSWKTAAKKALVNLNCVLAFYFRSESSMKKETIAKELETIKVIDHIKRIIAVDIWQESGMDANKFRNRLLNSGVLNEACERICDCVDIENKAIRLATDAGNDIRQLVEEMKEVMQDNGIEGISREIIDGPSKPQIEKSASRKHSLGELERMPAPAAQNTIAINDFLKKYNNSTFKKNTYTKFRLIGRGDYAVYTTDFYSSSYDLTWNFVKKILEERGGEYIRFVNEKNSGIKNPPFITKEEHEIRKARNDAVAYRQLDIPGLEGYSMCRHYGQYGWIDQVLKRRMQELGLPLEAFSFEYVTGEEAETPVSGGAAGRAPGGSYSFVLYGISYTNKKLKELMLTVFKAVMPRHLDKVDELIEKLPCLREGSSIDRDAKPAVFRAGEVVVIGEKEISIGTSLGRPAVLSYIGKLMSICGEARENLKIERFEY